MRPYAGGPVGTLNDIDLNVPAAAPEDDTVWLVTADMLHTADPEQHPFPHLRIAP